LALPSRFLRRAPSVATLLACLAAVLLMPGCSRKKKTAPAPFAPSPGWSESGVASWYGDPYHGRRAANGEVYDMAQLTAAHRTLPFGAIVLVTNLKNQKEVEVRITDRGPFVDGRIIDLSRGAAEAISMIGPGTAPVRIQLMRYGAARLDPAAGTYAVQVGAFSSRANADELSRRLASQYDPVEVVRREGSRAPWRVLVGRKTEQGDAETLAATLRREYKDVFVVRREEQPE
jgi:rare lipoprotein A